MATDPLVTSGGAGLTISGVGDIHSSRDGMVPPTAGLNVDAALIPGGRVPLWR